MNDRTKMALGRAIDYYLQNYCQRPSDEDNRELRANDSIELFKFADENNLHLSEETRRGR